MSQAARIRDAIAARLEALTIDGKRRFKRVQKDPLPQIQPDDCPALVVFILTEEMTPDGDGNAINLRFVADITIGIDILRGGGKVPTLSTLVDDDADAIFAKLFTDPEFTKFGADAYFESVERIERKRLFPKDGEAYFGELRLAIQFRTRVEYAITIPDDYSGADVNVRPLGNPAGDPISVRWDEQA